MGFNVVALAQKARTQTLIVDSDLNMGNYDLIATDVKGDTAEFAEFVGGVGNFESGLISGGLDVGDILHAESSMQIDGDLVVEGAINNVNITNEGAISTAKSVTATGGFKGNVTGSISGGTVAGSTGTFSGVITSGGLVIANTVIKSSGTITVASLNTGNNYIPFWGITPGPVTILTYAPNTKYSGTIVFGRDGSSTQQVQIYTSASSERVLVTPSTSGTAYTFSNISYLIASTYNTEGVWFRDFKLT